VRSAYLSMNLIGQFIIVPLSLAALLTGLIQSLGTHWGLFRHYWVSVKFVLTILAIIILLLHQFTAVEGAARSVMGSTAGTLPEVGKLGTQLVTDAGAALLVLLVITALGVFKPWGRTGDGFPLGLKVLLALAGLLVAVFVILHLTGHSLHSDH